MIGDVITAVFTTASAVVTGLASLIGDLIELIYDSGLTDFGTILIVVAAVPLAWNLLTYFVNLFRKAAKVK